MKKFTLIILLAVSILIFSGCIPKENGTNVFKLPTFTEKRLDRKLSTVKNLKAKTSMSKVALEWQPETKKNIAGYRIFRGDKNNKFELIATLKDRYQSHFIDTNLDPNINYIYKVSLYTDDGRVSMTSTAQSARTHSKLSAPIFLNISKGYPNRIKLIWRPHTNEITKSYIIQRKEKGKQDWKNITNIKDRLSVEYIDKDVIPGQEYKYRLFAKSYDGIISASSQELKGYAKKLPNMIKQIKATTNLPKKINIIWKPTNKPDDIEHYNIYSSPMKNTLFSYLGSSKKPQYTDTFETDGSTRYYKVTAVDYDGLESKKMDISKLGKTVSPNKAPEIIQATVRQNVVYLKWKDPSNKARSYTVVKKYWDGWRAKKKRITGFKKAAFTDRKIEIDTKYTYYIVSLDKHGIESEPSKEVVLAINPK